MKNEEDIIEDLREQVTITLSYGDWLEVIDVLYDYCEGYYAPEVELVCSLIRSQLDR